MNNNLLIFLSVLCILTLIILIIMVKRKKILFKHALLWCLFDLILFISLFCTDLLKKFSFLVGIEVLSNMVFLFGFLVLLAILIGATTLIAEQKNKIIMLTQELGILNNRIRKLEDEKDNKLN